jgi:hypothetical protein
VRKSIRMRGAVHVARVGKRTVAYKILVGIPGEIDNFEDIEVDGRIILKWMFKR